VANGDGVYSYCHAASNSNQQHQEKNFYLRRKRSSGGETSKQSNGRWEQHLEAMVVEFIILVMVVFYLSFILP